MLVVCVHECMFVRAYVRLCVSAGVATRAYVYVYACMRVCMYACMHEPAGVAIRLYSEKKMDKEFPSETVPEILRTNLSSTILTLKGMGIQDPVDFDYMDAPDADKIVAGLRMLYLFGALDADGEITSIGRDMALFPLEPALSRMLLASVLHSCADDMVTPSTHAS